MVPWVPLVDPGASNNSKINNLTQPLAPYVDLDASGNRNNNLTQPSAP
jgi:hypothetical protein